MATTENLKVKITADASQAKAEIGKFKDSLRGAVSEGNAATASIGKMTVALGAATVALKGWHTAIKNAINVAALGDAIRDEAQKVFMSTTAYQEWGYVMKQNGIEIGSLKVAMRQFAKEVANDSDVLRKYGITAKDVNGAFEQAVATLQNMTSETDKVAAATELFGTRALELYPILNLTNAETQNLMESYRLLGGTMSNELISASNICTDSITAMKAAWGGLKNVLAQWLIPTITKVVQWITLAIAKIRILLSAFFGLKETFGGSSGNNKNSLAGASGSVAANTGKTAGNLKKAAKQAKELKRTLMGIDELTKLVEQATAAAANNVGGGGGNISIGGADLEDIAEGTDSLFSDDMLDKLKAFSDKVEKIKDKLNGVYQIWKGWTELFIPGQTFQGISDMYEGFKKVFPVIQDVEDKVKDIWAKVKEKVETTLGIKIPTWNDIKAKWNALINNIKEKIVDVKVKFPEWGKDLKARWENLKKKFKNISFTITANFSTKVNQIKEWINGHIIAKINGALNKVKVFGTNPVPYLASGGILNAPTMAMLGEYAGAKQNPEIATPQSLMYETMMKANGDMVAAFATMTRQVIAAIEDKDLTVKIGDEQIARSAQRGNSAYKNRTGSALITV